MTISNSTDTKTAFIQYFSAQKGQSPDYGSAARESAEHALSSHDIPTRKWEDWKYTNLRRIFQRNYQSPASASEIQIAPYLINGLDADVLVFVNGQYQEAYSDISRNQGAIQVMHLQNLNGSSGEVFEAHFGKIISGSEDVFTALNTAYAQEGVLVYVSKNTQAKAPVHILHIIDDQAQAIACQHRNLFVVEASASAKVVESFHSLGTQGSFRNQQSEIFVGANADFEYVKLQLEGREHDCVDGIEIQQEKDSRCAIFTITLGGGLVRNNLQYQLIGENMESRLMGLYLLDGKQHLDNFTRVNHRKAHCYSNELYKGILADQATGVFSGRIHVFQEAQKTNAYQSNRNILLSDQANIFTKPQLEIYADDVRCSHGATTGQIEEEALFYLRSRGIPLDEARKILVHAFAMEVVEDLSLEVVQDLIADLVRNRY